MNTIPAREVKRRGISAVDEKLQSGPVHVIKNNHPSYVVLSEELYAHLMEENEEAHILRIKASLKDLREGRVTRGTAENLLAEIESEG